MKKTANLKMYHHQYYLKNKQKRLKYFRDRLHLNPDLYKNRNKKAKVETLTYYGNGICACVNCGEERLGCLSLDHINNNRTEETKRLGKPKYWGGPSLYIWLRKRSYPSGYQTLCMNCQWLKRIELQLKPQATVTRIRDLEVSRFITDNDVIPKRTGI